MQNKKKIKIPTVKYQIKEMTQDEIAIKIANLKERKEALKKNIKDVDELLSVYENA